MHTSINKPPTPEDWRDEWPHLAALRLSSDEFRTLCRQGFVCAERRGQRFYFKLRFRCNGRQLVRYIGDEQAARAVEVELNELQAFRRQTLELRRAQRITTELLRTTKAALTPFLEQRGFVFHGLAIRRPRQTRK